MGDEDQRVPCSDVSARCPHKNISLVRVVVLGVVVSSAMVCDGCGVVLS